MPAPVTFLVLFAMPAASGVPCIGIARAIRRRRARHPAYSAAYATTGSGGAVDIYWTTPSCDDSASPASGWTGTGADCGGAGASGGWDSAGSDSGGDGDGDGGGGGD